MSVYLCYKIPFSVHYFYVALRKASWSSGIALRYLRSGLQIPPADCDDATTLDQVLDQSLVSQDVNANTTRKLRCLSIQFGFAGAFSRIWRKDKTGLFVGNIVQGDQNPRITNLVNGTLEIRQIEPSDAGTYYCKISSGKGEEIQHILQVKSEYLTGI